MASRFLVFFIFGVVLAGSFFPPVFDYGFQKRCKGVRCVDLGESFRTSIYLQNLASIQPRTSLVKFARSPRTDRLVRIIIIITDRPGFHTKWWQYLIPNHKLEEVRDYFGENVALYWKWVGYLMSALILLTLVGSAVFMTLGSSEVR